ncbi:hypothetical protein NM208_g13417 [Fusarium decemcellulare]|uniref:Uncharacterized protein n=1 Tax=Fusarium decemcellulare TaxID=57161 RepID=A0ACC1RNG2_9HYPO|nr:hypothetical protein NM208_g13417 [Fusarium decemcellulare]
MSQPMSPHYLYCFLPVKGKAFTIAMNIFSSLYLWHHILARQADRDWLEPAIRAAPSWQQPYTTVARRLITEGHIDLLSLCKGSCPELPSWAPNWSQRVRSTWSGLESQGSSQRGTQLFHAGGDTVFDVDSGPDHDVYLTVAGYSVDTIREIGSIWAADLDDAFDWVAAKTILNEIEVFLARSAYYSEERKEEGKWRIPIGDKELGGLGSHRRATEASRSGWSTMRRAMETINPEGMYNSPEKISFLGMMNYMHESRPFISDLGYVGLCPAGAGPGDTIFIPAGGHVPYIIRCAGTQENLQQWRLLSESFVYSIMDNELGLERLDSSITRYQLR